MNTYTLLGLLDIHNLDAGDEGVDQTGFCSVSHSFPVKCAVGVM